VGALIVGDVEFPIDVEDRKFKTVALDLDRAAGGDIRGVAKHKLRSAGRRLRGVGHANSRGMPVEIDCRGMRAASTETCRIGYDNACCNASSTFIG
jgi:hypothetical protein